MLYAITNIRATFYAKIYKKKSKNVFNHNYKYFRKYLKVNIKIISISVNIL